MVKTTSIAASQLAASAADAAALMRALANEHRLLILCHLAEREEMSVGDLVVEVGLSQSALSQHLAKLRRQGFVSFRRDAQTLFYRVSDARVSSVLRLLYDMFCRDPRAGLPKTRMAPRSSQRKKASSGD